MVRTPRGSIDDDFNAWLLDQAAALRGLQPDSLDWQNLAEELEAMARTIEPRSEAIAKLIVSSIEMALSTRSSQQ